MKKLELKLEKHILLLENEGLIKRYLKNKDTFELFCDGHFWKPICIGEKLNEEIAKGLVERTENIPIVYINYSGEVNYAYAINSFISAIEKDGFGWENNRLGEYRCVSGQNGKLKNSCIDSCQGSCWDVDSDEWESLQHKTFDPTKTLILEKI